MRISKVKRSLIFSSLMSFALMLPLEVYASETNIKKEIIIKANSENEYREEAEKLLPISMKGGEKNYVRTTINYEIENKEYLEKKTKTIEMKEEPQNTYIENGITYKLEKSERIEKIIREEAVQAVNAYDDYAYDISIQDVPQTKSVNVINELTGEQENVVCTLSGIGLGDVNVVDTNMTITFTDYDASFFEFNGNYIARNDQEPPLSGIEEQLLTEAGAEDGSIVKEYYWEGEPYTENGIVYRKAVAKVQQQVQMHRANYVGEIRTPEQKETVYRVVYSTPNREGNVEYMVKATAEYEKETPYTLYVVAGIGLLIVVGLLTAVLIVLAKRKKKKENRNV